MPPRATPKTAGGQAPLGDRSLAPAAPAIAKTIPSGPAQETLEMVDVNRALLARYQAKLRELFAGEIKAYGAALQKACPRKIGDGGATAHPFCTEDFEKCMRNSTARPEYRCMLNLFWLDIARLAVPGIPLNQGAIDHFRRQFFDQGPRPIPAETPITIVVSKSCVAGGFAPPLQKLRRASGCEAILAFVDAMVAATSSDPDTIVEWAKAALQTPAILIDFADNEADIMKFAIQAKHDWKKVGDSMATNTLQFIYQIMVAKSIVVSQTGSSSGELKHEIEEFYSGIRVSDEEQKVTAEVAARCGKIYHELLSNEKAAQPPNNSPEKLCKCFQCCVSRVPADFCVGVPVGAGSVFSLLLGRSGSGVRADTDSFGAGGGEPPRGQTPACFHVAPRWCGSSRWCWVGLLVAAGSVWVWSASRHRLIWGGRW